jgi:hypothetical protein
MIFYFSYLAIFKRKVFFKLFCMYLVFQVIILIHLYFFLCFIQIKFILKNKKIFISK